MARSLWAPGRVNLIGGHTDYSGGLVLPVAIQLGITLTFDRADRIALESSGATHGWQRYVTAVADELAALGRPSVGIEGRLEADLPQGAGLGSSGTLEGFVALALCEAAGLELAPLQLAIACQRAEQ